MDRRLVRQPYDARSERPLVDRVAPANGARSFIVQRELEEWIASGVAVVNDGHFFVTESGARYRLVEAARVLHEASGNPDAYELVGQIKSLGHLGELGAEVLGTSMILGDNAYEVELGWIALPVRMRWTSGVRRKPELDDTAPSVDDLAEYVLRLMGSGG